MGHKQAPGARLIDFPTEEEGLLNAIIETPRGSRGKLAYDEKSGLFKLRHVLPAGAIFPYNFGFLPSTHCEDGDPLDILVLLDVVVYPGCLIPSRLIGVIEAEQVETDGRRVRNDRLLAVADQCPTYRGVQTIEQVSGELLEQIEYFFVSYNAHRGKKFKPLGCFGPKRAEALVRAAMERYKHAPQS